MTHNCQSLCIGAVKDYIANISVTLICRHVHVSQRGLHNTIGMECLLLLNNKPNMCFPCFQLMMADVIKLKFVRV